MKAKNTIDWQIVARYFAGKISDSERNIIETWMKDDPQKRKSIESMRTIWKLSGRKSHEWDVDATWEKVCQQARIVPSKELLKSSGLPSRLSKIVRFTRMPNMSLHRIAAAGAAIVCLILISLVIVQWKNIFKSPQSVTREISTGKGQQAKLELTDGTKIRLNAASIVRFPEKFDQGTRELFLQGEAYFEVTRMDGIPFIVHMQGATIEVLGTEFNVEAWPEDKQIEVVVAAGKVLFKSDSGSEAQQVVLTRGQMSKIYEKGTPSFPAIVDLNKQLAWINGHLDFVNTPLRDVIRNLERRYNLTFSVSDSLLLMRRLTTSFKDEPIDDILNVIALSLDVKYKRLNSSVSLYRQPGTKQRKPNSVNGINVN